MTEEKKIFIICKYQIDRSLSQCVQLQARLNNDKLKLLLFVSYDNIHQCTRNRHKTINSYTHITASIATSKLDMSLPSSLTSNYNIVG